MIVMLCGITLPLVALVWEALGHPCADMWFDPIPTGGHMLLIATVPLVSSAWAPGMFATLRWPPSMPSWRAPRRAPACAYTPTLRHW